MENNMYVKLPMNVSEYDNPASSPNLIISNNTNMTKEEIEDIPKHDDLEEEIKDILKPLDLALKEGHWLELERENLRDNSDDEFSDDYGTDESDNEEMNNEVKVKANSGSVECWTDESDTEDWDDRSSSSKAGEIVTMIAGGMLTAICMITIGCLCIMLV